MAFDHSYVSRNRSLAWAVAAVVILGLLGTFMAGDGLEEWYPNLEKPWFSLPLEAWFVVGALYYLVIGSLIFRILRFQPPGTWKKRLLGLTLLIGFYNEAWNYLFLGLQSTLAAFISMFPFFILVVYLFALLRKFDRTASWILLPYGIWIFYDLIWSYGLWKLN